jgi:hypothetical protein
MPLIFIFSYDCIFDGFIAQDYRCFEEKCIHISYIPQGYCDATIPCVSEADTNCVRNTCIDPKAKTGGRCNIEFASAGQKVKLTVAFVV